MRAFHRRRSLTLTACLVLVLVLLTAVTPGVVPRTLAARRAASHVTINWWELWSLPGIKTLVKDFERSHPDITVNVTVYPNVGDDSQGKLLAAVAGHRPPDLVLAYDDSLAGWAGKGEIAPIDAYVNQVGIKSADYVSPAWQSAQWQGHVYGIPVDWDPDAMLWYNKSVFKAAGLDPNKPPATWAQFTADAAKIDLIQGGKIKRVGIAPWDGWIFNPVEFGHLFGMDFQDGASKTVKLDAPAMRKELAWEQSVATKFGGQAKINAFISPPNLTTGMAASDLLAGRVGMQSIGDWLIATGETDLGVAGFAKVIGVTPMPVPPGGQNYLSHSGWAFMVPHGAPNAAAAMQFVQWLSQDANVVKLTGTLGWLPARVSARSAKIYQDPNWQRVLAVNREAPSEGFWLRPSPILTQYYQALLNAESAVVNLKQTPTQALSTAQKVAQQALQDALSSGAYGG